MTKEQMNVHLYVLGHHRGTRRVTVSPDSLLGQLARGDLAGALEAVQRMEAEIRAAMAVADAIKDGGLNDPEASQGHLVAWALLGNESADFIGASQAASF